MTKVKNVVHAGWAPGNYYVKQLNDKDWIGIGLFSRFGMISEFERDSKVASNAFFSRLNGASLTPTYARKFDNKWSAAVGAEVNYVGLELQKMRWALFLHKQKEKAGPWAGMRAANYAFDSKNEIGLVYRSKVTHTMDADFRGYSSGITGSDHLPKRMEKLLCRTAGLLVTTINSMIGPG